VRGERHQKDPPRPCQRSQVAGHAGIGKSARQPLPEENIFRDDGYSGAGLNRPGLDQLRNRAGELDQVILTAPDRQARNYVHQMVLIEKLENHGCRVEFLDRPMSQEPHDQLLLQIRGLWRNVNGS